MRRPYPKAFDRGGPLLLGLAIVKELTHLLSGEIKVESEWGRGSTFTLFLPNRLSSEPPAGKAVKARMQRIPKLLWMK